MYFKTIFYIYIYYIYRFQISYIFVDWELTIWGERMGQTARGSRERVWARARSSIFTKLSPQQITMISSPMHLDRKAAFWGSLDPINLSWPVTKNNAGLGFDSARGHRHDFKTRLLGNCIFQILDLQGFVDPFFLRHPTPRCPCWGAPVKGEVYGKSSIRCDSITISRASLLRLRRVLVGCEVHGRYPPGFVVAKLVREELVTQAEFLPPSTTWLHGFRAGKVLADQVVEERWDLWMRFAICCIL